MPHAGGSDDTSSDGDETYVTTFEPGDRPSESVVTAIESLTDEPATELTPLYDAIEPDALDALFEHARRTDQPGRQRLTFTYAGYEIAVHGDGTLEVTPR